LCARETVREPFAVINADDFCGRESYAVAAKFLTATAAGASRFAMVGFRLDKTLSANGTVTRGVCKTDAANLLTAIEEMTKIARAADGRIYNTETGGAPVPLTGLEPSSMNLWCFTPRLFEHLDRVFREFLDAAGGALKSECFIPVTVGQLVREKLATCEVLRTQSDWFGITYREDKAEVQGKIAALVASGAYPANLWA
jgi:hypothetical protein